MGSPPKMSFAISCALTMRRGYALCWPLIDTPKTLSSGLRYPASSGAKAGNELEIGDAIRPYAAPHDLGEVYQRFLSVRNQEVPEPRVYERQQVGLPLHVTLRGLELFTVVAVPLQPLPPTLRGSGRIVAGDICQEGERLKNHAAGPKEPHHLQHYRHERLVAVQPRQLQRTHGIRLLLATAGKQAAHVLGGIVPLRRILLRSRRGGRGVRCLGGHGSLRRRRVGRRHGRFRDRGG